jgi:hypothetical protein
LLAVRKESECIIEVRGYICLVELTH